MARKAKAREPIPTMIRLYGKAERRESTKADGPRGPRLARVRAFLASGKLPAAWGKPTPPYQGRAGLSLEEARRVVLPNFPEAELRLREGDLGVERAVGRYLESRGERELTKAVEARWNGAGAYTNAEAAAWSCGCKVWQDTATVYTAGPRGLREFSHYIPARVEPCARHERALLGVEEEAAAGAQADAGEGEQAGA